MKPLKKAVQEYLDFEVSDPSIIVEGALENVSLDVKKKWKKMLKSSQRIWFCHRWVDGDFYLYSDND